MGANEILRSNPHATAQRRLLNQPQGGFCQSRHVPRTYKHAGAFVSYNFSESPNVRGDHGNAGSASLQNDAWNALHMTGYQHYVRPAHELGSVASGSKKVNVRVQSQGPYAGMNGFPQRSIPNQYQLAIPTDGSNGREGVNQPFVVLLRGKTADV
jgi:hypothetical protein